MTKIDVQANPLKQNIPLSLKRLYKDIQKDLDKIEKELQDFGKSSNRIIDEINSFLFQKAGKRIRPALLVLCARLTGYEGDDHIQMAAFVEAIHTASLIHDDIIDNSQLRRGRKTVHSKWGPNITVLLGDYLYIKTLNRSLQTGHPEITRILTETSSLMIDGELYEYGMSTNLDISESAYFDILYKKTATLFSASCQIGAVLAEASKEDEQALKDYGSHIGMSFQIIDDLLDYTGEEKKLGKPVLSDLSEGRITLPLIHTLNNHNGKANRKMITKLMADTTLKEDSKKEILEIIKSNGALDYSFSKAKEYSQKAQEVLYRFPDTVYREALHFLPDFVVERNL